MEGGGIVGWLTKIKAWRQPSHLSPETVLATMPQVAHSLVVHLGPLDHERPCYWQLRQQGQHHDRALLAVSLPDREAKLPLTAAAVADFCQASAAAGIEAVYLLGVATADLVAGVLDQVSAGAPRPQGKATYLVLPAQTLYDFLANETQSMPGQVPLVGELLDGWPMHQAKTLSAYVLAQRPADEPGIFSPVPSGARQYDQWEHAEPAVAALFDAPLRQVADSGHGATFVFTDID